MPTDGSIISFQQIIPAYADKNFISNTFASSFYESISENVIGAGKLYLSAVNGLSSDDVRISKRIGLSASKLRGFEPGKVGPKDGNDYIGGNYATVVNFEANFPNFFPEKSNAEVGLFLDAGNLWGVDYSDAIDDSNKIRSTIGLNTSWMSPAGPLSFIFSQNLTKASTDQAQSFNFRLGTTF